MMTPSRALPVPFRPFMHPSAFPAGHLYDEPVGPSLPDHYACGTPIAAARYCTFRSRRTVRDIHRRPYRPGMTRICFGSRLMTRLIRQIIMHAPQVRAFAYEDDPFETIVIPQ
jgi:hypothetical protein